MIVSSTLDFVSKVAGVNSRGKKLNFLKFKIKAFFVFFNNWPVRKVVKNAFPTSVVCFESAKVVLENDSELPIRRSRAINCLKISKFVEFLFSKKPQI